MNRKRTAAVIIAALCAALIYAIGENGGTERISASVKIERSYMLNAIKANIENDPESPFSVFAENELETGRDVAALYSEIAKRSCETNFSASSVRMNDCARIVCASSPKRNAVSFDGSVWYYGGNYFIGYDESGVSVVVRSPVGMIKSAPKDAKLCIRGGDKIVSILSSASGREDIAVRVGRADGAEALCVVDTSLSSPVLYDFSYFRRQEK